MQPQEFQFIQDLTADLSSRELVFPTSLNATMKIRSALNNADSSIEKIVRVIGTEPVVSAHILRMSNSATFNPNNQPTADLHKATVRLGITKVRNIAIWVGMKQLTESGTKGPTTHLVDGLWKRTIRIAATSFIIARDLTDLDPDSAMMAGLLHDIGKFYILYRAGKYSELFVSESALWEIIDHWHQDIGASILESWEVADDIRSAILDCRDFDRTHRGKPDLADVVAAADILDGDCCSETARKIDWGLTPRVLTVLKLDKRSSEALMNDARDHVTTISAALP